MKYFEENYLRLFIVGSRHGNNETHTHAKFHPHACKFDE